MTENAVSRLLPIWLAFKPVATVALGLLLACMTAIMVLCLIEEGVDVRLDKAPAADVERLMFRLSMNEWNGGDSAS